MTIVENADVAEALVDTGAEGRSQTSTARAGERTRADVIDATTAATVAGIVTVDRAVTGMTTDVATSTIEEVEEEIGVNVMHTAVAAVRSASVALLHQ